ncbi:hypothetical protein [Deinococcus sp. UYEF24]
MKPAPFTSDLSPSSRPLDRPANGSLDAALERQRRQHDFENTLEDHAGPLDIERLVGTLPGSRTPVGQALKRDLRRNGRYVRLSRPLGHAALTWDAQTSHGIGSQGPGARGWQASRLVTALGWLERLSGVRLPAGRQNDKALTLGPGEVTLLLPASSGGLNVNAGLLLAEREGQLFQYLPVPDGRWYLLESVTDLRTEQVAMIDEGRLGLERLPTVWSTLSSARRQERARRLRVASLLLVLTLFVLIGRLLTHSGLWLLVGPALVVTLLLAAMLEQRFSQWVRHGAALRQNGPALELLFPEAGSAAPSSASGLHADGRPFQPTHFQPAPFQLAQHERLLSPGTLARLTALRAELNRARSTFSPDLTVTLTSDLTGLLEDRFSYPHPDPALDALLDGQMATLSARLSERLDLERQRARELAAGRLRRETVDPHF